MSMETDVLLRTILFQAKSADSLESIRIAIEAMCTEDMISAVEKKVAQVKELKK